MLEGASELDWEYKHVSNKLFVVLDAYLDVDPTKIIDESKEQCGLEAYCLLSRAYDPLIADTEHVLISHVLALSQWSVKGLPQIESLMREAKLRIVTYEKVTNKKAAGIPSKEVRRGRSARYSTTSSTSKSRRTFTASRRRRRGLMASREDDRVQGGS